MIKQYNVLSVFNGIGCGWVALDKAGIVVGDRFSSEIDEPAILVNDDNYPDTIQVGDITKLTYIDGVLSNGTSDYKSKINLFIGGSPCQTVSLANGGGKDIEDGKSKLFFEYVRILEEIRLVNPEVFFLLENVPMSKRNADIITGILGVEPIIINSNLVSFQNRKRLYWTNIPNVGQPEDKKILLRDNFCQTYDDDLILRGNGLNKLSRDRNRAMSVHNDKSPTIMKSQEKKPTDSVVFEQDGIHRYPTRRECELMQNLPIGYTKAINYRLATGAIGNGWTVDVIAHIFNNFQ